ncbi:unnamed protein product [Amoebophrya sp. A120]|nr:unnamed protein product [Amoebophrya sp. A120]|eukprot:GSA120T00014780001.1
MAPGGALLKVSGASSVWGGPCARVWTALRLWQLDGSAGGRRAPTVAVHKSACVPACGAADESDPVFKRSPPASARVPTPPPAVRENYNGPGPWPVARPAAPSPFVAGRPALLRAANQGRGARAVGLGARAKKSPPVLVPVCFFPDPRRLSCPCSPGGASRPDGLSAQPPACCVAGSLVLARAAGGVNVICLGAGAILHCGPVASGGWRASCISGDRSVRLLSLL